MIEIVKDVDLFDHVGEYDVVLVGTNVYCTMAQGLQLKVMLNYPYAFEKNLDTKYGDPRKMGTILECAKDGEPTFCLCFITKGYNFQPHKESDYLSYESLEKCLSLVNILYKGKNVACPLLGVSKYEGNGDRDRIMDIFEKTVKDVNLTIYDYYQKGRNEELVEILKGETKVKETDRKAYYKMVGERKKKAEERFRKNGHRRY